MDIGVDGSFYLTVLMIMMMGCICQPSTKGDRGLAYTASGMGFGKDATETIHLQHARARILLMRPIQIQRRRGSHLSHLAELGTTPDWAQRRDIPSTLT